MSLLTYASPWVSDNTPKKRTSSIRKSNKPSTIMNDSGGEPEEYTITSSAPSPNNIPQTLDEVQSYNDEKNTKVYDLLNKMSELDAENDGNYLANFSPISPPSINSKSQFMQSNSQINNNVQNNYSPDNRGLANLTNYKYAYENTPLFKNKPYYANMGISNGIDNKLMERINYMVHLLEEQQHEKTANITEEFLLYSFLGVFVIYVVDTFSRNGKYVR